MDLRGIVFGGLLLTASAVRAAVPLPPDGHVVDLAGVLDSPGALQLSGTLTSYVDATGLDIGIVTVAELQREPLPEYARRTLQARSIASPYTLLLVWSPPQQLVIAASAPYSEYLSPAEIQRVLDEHALPNLRAGRVTEGLLQAVYALMVAVGERADERIQSGPIIMLADAMPADDAAPTRRPVTPQPWLRDPLAALADLGRRLPDAPGAALAMIWQTGTAQGRDLGRWLQAHAQQLRAWLSGGVAPPPDHLAFWAAGLAAAVMLAVILFRVGYRRRRPGLAATIAGSAVAAACWLLVGYLELALLLAVAGPLLWGLLRLLPVLLARADQERLHEPATIPGLRSAPPVPMRPASAPPRASAMRPAATVRAPPAAPTPTPTPTPAAQGSRPDILAALGRAHADGIRTPALDHLIAQRGKPALARRQKQRQYWLLAIAICFFVAFPIALLLLIVWAITELNHLKPPQQQLGVFLRQLWSELQQVGAHRRPRA